MNRHDWIDTLTNETYDGHVCCLRAVDLDTDEGRQTNTSVVQPNENATWNLSGPCGVFLQLSTNPLYVYTNVDRLQSTVPICKGIFPFYAKLRTEISLCRQRFLAVTLSPVLSNGSINTNVEQAMRVGYSLRRRTCVDRESLPLMASSLQIG
jgi:hypothetical protein